MNPQGSTRSATFTAGLVFLAEIYRLVREDVTHGPEEIKNTVVRFDCLLVDRRTPFALDGRAVPALGMTDKAIRRGARFERHDERLS